jgi:hypothetical protein
MPATNPRLTITLKPTTSAQLRRLSELTGNSQSALIAELLEGSEQVFDRLITLLQAATDAKASLTDQMVAELEQTQTKLEGQMGLALNAWDAGAKPILDAAESIQRRGRRRGRGGDAQRPAAVAAQVPTPPSNRGVRSGPKQAKKPTRTRT